VTSTVTRYFLLKGVFVKLFRYARFEMVLYSGVTHRGCGTTDGADYRLVSTLFDIDVEHSS
jgi:hypothetical protein